MTRGAADRVPPQPPMSPLRPGWEHLLSSSGPFASRIAGFAPRCQQLEMAQAVARALDDYGVLVCEAGTGTGKTLAYLCPILMSGRKAIVSTGTKNLQEQLYRRDLPLVRDALGLVVSTALLKGRANYLCQQRLSASEQQPSLDPVDQAQVAAVRAWEGRTRTGDTSECTEIPEKSPVWARVTSTVDNCLGTDCPHYSECYVLKARRAAIEADVLVVNHHLFFADLALREEGFGELLPGSHAVVFDEAHQIPDIATRFFGVSVSSGQLRELARDALVAYRAEADDCASLESRAVALERAAAQLGADLKGSGHRVAWPELANSLHVERAVTELEASLAELSEALEPLAARGKALENCSRRCLDFSTRVAQLRGPATADSVQWVEVHGKGFVWHESPLEIAGVLSARIAAERRAWIFTSATLAVNECLDHFTARVGLTGHESRVWGSPFDYSHQSLCYLPSHLPDPRDPGYTNAVVGAVLPVLEASAGRAFFLFTSYAALERARRRLEALADYPLFVQGQAPRDALLRLFRETPRAVLLGTNSFWEGVDVRGDALSCVIIEKLPFASPDDPVLQARSSALRASGEDPFIQFQLPQAVLALKQGVGRLIRDQGDVGVLVLCDPRLSTRPYGKVFLRSLPPMPVTRALDDVREFFAADPRDA